MSRLGAEQQFCLSTPESHAGRGWIRGEVTSWRHHLPGLRFLPRLPLGPALFGSGTLNRSGSSESKNKCPGTGTGHSQEVTPHFRPRCFDTCRCVEVYSGDISAPTPVWISTDYVEKTLKLFYNRRPCFADAPSTSSETLTETENHKQGTVITVFVTEL